MLKEIELVLDFSCNCRCVFCVVDARAAGQRMSTAAALRALARARGQGAWAVNFGGGEPTLRDDLPQLGLAARKLGYRRVGVKTNGLRLCYPDYVDRLLRCGIRHFTVPVWGATPEAHDGLARTPGAFEMLEMGVKNVIDAGGRVEAATLITTRSIDSLTDMIEHFAGLGVRRFQIALFCLFGSHDERPDLLPSMNRAGRAIAKAARALRTRRLELFTTHVPPCLLGGAARLYRNSADSGLEIVTPGGAFPVQASPFEAGRQTDRCAGCRRRKDCAGIRPEYLARFSDRELKPIRRGAS